MKKEATAKNYNEVNMHFSKGEELFNGISHAIGIGIGIAVLTLGIVFAAIFNEGALPVLSMIIYGICMIVSYSASSIYHFLPSGKAKYKWQIVDHCAIYLLIAGTYTPFCWILLSHLPAGWILFGLIWGFSILGIVLNAINMNNKIIKIYSLLSYILLGWCCVFVFGHIVANMLALGYIFLILGGVTYTIGAVLYVISQKKRYVHSVWHILVMVGTLFHFFSILFYVVIY